jgi:enoyl-CoA hydratase/carnithine racemase
MAAEVDVARDGALLRISLARPEKKNALTGAMYDALTHALNETVREDGVRAVLIAGSGGSFCAGNDIADFAAVADDFRSAPSLRFIRALALCETPLVAAVEGVAVGVGTTMLLHCDLVYAAPDARFRMPFVDLGLVPEAASSLLVPRRFGLVKATEFLLLGEALGAEEALRLGLINAIVPAEALLDHAAVRARALAATPAAALAATRRLIRGDRTEIIARIDAEAEAFAVAVQSPEAQAAFAAFTAKSKAGRT